MVWVCVGDCGPCVLRLMNLWVLLCFALVWILGLVVWFGGGCCCGFGGWQVVVW